MYYFLAILLFFCALLADFPLTAERLSFKDQDFSLVVTSTYLQKELYIIDEERWQVVAPFTILEKDKWAVKTRFSLGYTGAGLMDGAIHEWHYFFGLPQSGRGDERKSRYEIRGFRTDGVPFSFNNRGAFFESPRVYVERDNFILGTSVPISTNNEHPSSPEIGIRYQESFDQFHIGFGGIYYTDTNVGEVLYKDWHYEGDLVWSFKIQENFGGALGSSISSPPYRKMGYVPTIISYLDFELNYKFENGLLFLSLQENPGSGEMTSDVRFILGWRGS